MQPRRIDLRRDLPGVADLLGRTRALGGLSHPGGIQWWLRELTRVDRDDFDAFVWADTTAAIGGFALVDGTFVVAERAERGPAALEQIEWLEGEMQSRGRPTLDLHVAASDPLLDDLVRRGFHQVGAELELLANVAAEPARVRLPDGFRFASALDVTDDQFIEGHRAAWSDQRPSPYRRALHDAVTQMPQFRRELVTIALAPDRTVASYCIGWMDEQSKTLEIEPLGTHRDYRRLGLAHAVVKEVHHRAWDVGADRVLVWNDPASNPAAYALYTGAGMAPDRTLIQLRRPL